MGLSLAKMYPKELRKVTLPKGQVTLLDQDRSWQKALANLGLVGKVVRSFINQGLPEEDLIQIGIIGLFKAAQSYMPELGSFSNHAIIKIRGEILWALKEHYRLVEIARKYQNLISEGSQPLPFELLQREEAKEMVKKILDEFNQRDRQILNLRYGLNGDEPLSKQETGKRLGVTGEAIRQAEEKLLNRLRKAFFRTEVK